MNEVANAPLTIQELAGEHGAELPARDLLITVSVLGIPLAGVGGVDVIVDTSGPNWLFGGIGSV